MCYSSTHIHDVISEVENLFGPEADKKGVQLSNDISADVPRTFQTDPQRLKQVLMNLVGNGVKFTNEGNVTQSAKLRVDEDKHTWIEFAVTDTGIGIAADDGQGLFQPFNQVDNSLARQYGGSGLGLSISKHLIELLGGDIWFESKPGVGSTFSFKLPAIPDA